MGLEKVLERHRDVGSVLLGFQVWGREELVWRLNRVLKEYGRRVAPFLYGMVLMRNQLVSIHGCSSFYQYM